MATPKKPTKKTTKTSKESSSKSVKVHDLPPKNDKDVKGGGGGNIPGSTFTASDFNVHGKGH